MFQKYAAPAIVCMSIALCVGTFRLYLHQSARELGEQFKTQNLLPLASSDTFSLASKLNALSSAKTSNCIVAKRAGSLFFQEQLGVCKSGFWNEQVLITNPPANDLQIAITVQLPETLKDACIGFIILQTALLIWLAATAKRNEKKKADILAARLNTEKEFTSIAAQVAHDIRSPLAALRVAAKSVEHLDDESHQLIEAAVGRINSIANGLLERYRLRVPKPLAHTEQANVSLNAIIDSLLKEKRTQFRDREDLSILPLEKPETEVTTVADPMVVARIISNLVNNSAEAMSRGGSIQVSLERKSRTTVVTIKDNGPGIPRQILKHLGNRIVTFGKENGTGLGLFHAKTTLKKLGGSLKISSTLGKGTCVKVILPHVRHPNRDLADCAIASRFVHFFDSSLPTSFTIE